MFVALWRIIWKSHKLLSLVQVCTVQHASLQLDVYSSPGNHLKHQLRKWLQYDPVNPSRFTNVSFESRMVFATQWGFCECDWSPVSSRPFSDASDRREILSRPELRSTQLEARHTSGREVNEFVWCLRLSPHKSEKCSQVRFIVSLNWENGLFLF